MQTKLSPLFIIVQRRMDSRKNWELAKGPCGYLDDIADLTTLTLIATTLL